KLTSLRAITPGNRLVSLVTATAVDSLASMACLPVYAARPSIVWCEFIDVFLGNEDGARSLRHCRQQCLIDVCVHGFTFVRHDKGSTGIIRFLPWKKHGGVVVRAVLDVTDGILGASDRIDSNIGSRFFTDRSDRLLGTASLVVPRRDDYIQIGMGTKCVLNDA